MSRARDIADLSSVSARLDTLGGSSGSFGVGRNVLINSEMKVAQRATSKTGLTNFNNGYHTLDRFKFEESGSPSYQFTMSQSTTSPDGFGYSLKMDCTTAQGSLGAGDTLAIQQRIEGQNLQQFQKGTSTAKQWTMSFYVRGTTTGTYICQLFDNDNNRFVSKSYTIDTANTWERKTITFPADTTGALNNSNGASLLVIWYLAAGSNFTSGTLQTDWGGNTAANKAVGQVNLASSTSNDWYMTGCQLELGDTATDFEHEPYETTLRKCQRYLSILLRDDENDDQNIGSVYSATRCFIKVFHKVTMRAVPTISLVGTIGANLYNNGSSVSATGINASYPKTDSTGLDFTPSSSLSGGTAFHLDWTQTSSSHYVKAEAEL